LHELQVGAGDRILVTVDEIKFDMGKIYAITGESGYELDSNSVKVAERMLKRYLPNTLILVVDHYAKDNNYDGFYGQELYFADKKVTLRDMI